MKFDLETLVYLLFILGIFLYNTFVKAKRKRATREKGGEQAEEDGGGPFGEIWGDLGIPPARETEAEAPVFPEAGSQQAEEAGTEPVTMEQPVPEEVLQPVVPAPDKRIMPELEAAPVLQAEKLKTPPAAAKEEKTPPAVEEFDLEKAVIYSEVLNRKHF